MQLTRSSYSSTSPSPSSYDAGALVVRSTTAWPYWRRRRWHNGLRRLLRYGRWRGEMLAASRGRAHRACRRLPPPARSPDQASQKGSFVPSRQQKPRPQKPVAHSVLVLGALPLADDARVGVRVRAGRQLQHLDPRHLGLLLVAERLLRRLLLRTLLRRLGARFDLVLRRADGASEIASDAMRAGCAKLTGAVKREEEAPGHAEARSSPGERRVSTVHGRSSRTLLSHSQSC